MNAVMLPARTHLLTALTTTISFAEVSSWAATIGARRGREDGHRAALLRPPARLDAVGDEEAEEEISVKIRVSCAAQRQVGVAEEPRHGALPCPQNHWRVGALGVVQRGLDRPREFEVARVLGAGHHGPGFRV